jgi:hypothetical protein
MRASAARHRSAEAAAVTLLRSAISSWPLRHLAYMRGQCFGAVADPLGDLSWDYFRTLSPALTPSALGAPLAKPAATTAQACCPRWRRHTVAGEASGRRCKGGPPAERPASPSHKGRFPLGGGGARGGPRQERNADHGDHCGGRDRSPLAAVGGERPADQIWTFPTPVWVMFRILRM